MSEPEVTGNPLERQKMTTTLWSFFESGSKDYNEAKSKTKGKIMYKFSAPMPYTKDDIDKLLNINKQVEKSRITSLYACVPRGCDLFTGFEQSRNFSFNNTSVDYWKKLIEYVLFNDCDFIYLLNSPCALDVDNPDFCIKLEKLEKLLEFLREIGVKKIRVASAQLMSYMGKYYNDFEILASTSLEYKTIWEYQNFIEFHPEVKQIVPSHDINKNFKLLSLLRKRYPKIEIELMVNEGCLQGCPNRMFHEMSSIDKFVILNNEEYLSGGYATLFCNAIVQKYPIHSLVIGSHIFPWDIEEYAKIGITNFKLVGRDGFDNFDSYLKAYNMYLKGIDNVDKIQKYTLNDFIHHLKNNQLLKQLTVKDYKKYLPNIKHFKKYGHLCASRCAVECRYCYNCAEKIQKVFKKKQQEQMKRTVPFCKKLNTNLETVKN